MLPRLVRERIIAEYISGVKTPQMLSKEYPMSRNAIIKIVCRYRQAGNSITFDNKSILGPMKPKINAEHIAVSFLIFIFVASVLRGVGGRIRNLDIESV